MVVWVVLWWRRRGDSLACLGRLDDGDFEWEHLTSPQRRYRRLWRPHKDVGMLQYRPSRP